MKYTEEICIERFYAPSNRTYDEALQQVKDGKKTSHWIWWIFPQMRGLGKSERSYFYGISGKKEAKAFIDDPILGPRLIEICQEVLKSKTSVYDIFDYDSIKVKSCCKLFAEVSDNPVFKDIIKRYNW